MPAATGQRSTTATKRPNPRDYTGVQKAKAEAAVAEQLEERAAEMAMAAEARDYRDANEVIDYSKEGIGVPQPEQPSPSRSIHPDLAAEIEQAGEIEVGPQVVEVRVKAKLEQMVFGRQVFREAFTDAEGRYHEPQLGNLNFYDFEEGRRYLVPIELARHLDELDYLWH